MLNLRGFVRISGSLKRTSRLGTKYVLSLPRTSLFHTTGTMATKIQGIVSYVHWYVVGLFYRNHVVPN